MIIPKAIVMMTLLIEITPPKAVEHNLNADVWKSCPAVPKSPITRSIASDGTALGTMKLFFNENSENIVPKKTNERTIIQELSVFLNSLIVTTASPLVNPETSARASPILSAE